MPVEVITRTSRHCEGCAYLGPGDPCYDGAGGTGKNCPSVCKQKTIMRW